MKCIVHAARRGTNGGLEPLAIVDVPDTSTDPETAAWTIYTRANPGLDPGNYVVTRQGKGFIRRRQPTMVNTATGLVTP